MGFNYMIENLLLTLTPVFEEEPLYTGIFSHLLSELYFKSRPYCGYISYRLHKTLNKFNRSVELLPFSTSHANTQIALISSTLLMYTLYRLQ